MHHELKTHPAAFERVRTGEKTFDVRRDNDRGFQAGDTVTLREYDRSRAHDCDDATCTSNRYTGRALQASVGFVAKGETFGLELGPYAILSLVNIDRGPRS